MVGVFWGAFTDKEPQAYQENMAELIGWYLAGKVKPVIEGAYPLADAADVLKRVLGRGATGKLILTALRRARVAMPIPTEMQALLLVKVTATPRRPPAARSKPWSPMSSWAAIGVPSPKPTQLLIKVALAAINPSDVMFLKGQYGQPREGPAGRLRGRRHGGRDRRRAGGAGSCRQPRRLRDRRLRLGLVGGIRDRRGRPPRSR